MKFTQNISLTKLIYFVCVLLAFIFNGSHSLNLKDNGREVIFTDKTEAVEGIFLEKSEMQKKKKKKSKTQWPVGTLNTFPVAAGKPEFKNDTFSKAAYRDINNTFVGQKINVFLFNQRKWDWKLLDKQLQDVAMDMNYQADYGHTPEGIRAFIKYFINYFEDCDKNQDKVLSRKEFSDCLKNDTFLSTIDLPNKNYSALTSSPFNYTNPNEYSNILFNLLDTMDENFINFHSYMHLRLFVFSWRRCSVAAPFIEESNFECAIEVAAGWKTMSRNTVRKLFFLSLELSGSESIRNLDFITYVSFAQAVRLYGKINGKEDNDITRNELNLALDNNILPKRYNQDVINYFFKLIEERDRPNQGIDLLTFCFYDFWLKLFHMEENSRKYYLNTTEFTKIFYNPLFTIPLSNELAKIPQNNLTLDSYQMYTYLNISNYQDESDHFLKSFLETSAEVKLNSKKFLSKEKKWSINEAVNGNTEFTFRKNETMAYLFKVIDMNNDGFINFFDFGSFVQISYLFMRFDIYQKGRIVAGDLYDNYTNYSDFPLVTYLVRERARKFNLMPQDLYLDIYSVILTLKIEDLINVAIRRSDKTTLFEIELKNIFALVNRKWIPDAYLNRCLRGTNADNIPLYDWECAFIQSEIRTMTFYENSFDRLTVKANNITLFNTVFYNIESHLPQQGTISGELGSSGAGSNSNTGSTSGAAPPKSSASRYFY